MTRSTTWLVWGAVSVLAASCSNREPDGGDRETPSAESLDEACGGQGLPDCPTQAWMKANLQAYLQAEDFPRLARSFAAPSAVEAVGYSSWEAIAERGAAAARAADPAGAKAACKACHSEHRKRFKLELRYRRLLP